MWMLILTLISTNVFDGGIGQSVIVVEDLSSEAECKALAAKWNGYSNPPKYSDVKKSAICHKRG